MIPQKLHVLAWPIILQIVTEEAWTLCWEVSLKGELLFVLTSLTVLRRSRERVTPLRACPKSKAEKGRL